MPFAFIGRPGQHDEDQEDGGKPGHHFDPNAVHDNDRGGEPRGGTSSSGTRRLVAHEDATWQAARARQATVYSAVHMAALELSPLVRCAVAMNPVKTDKMLRAAIRLFKFLGTTITSLKVTLFTLTLL